MRDEGHAAIELALATAVLLVPVAIAVLSFGPWSERRVAVEAIAAEAARAVAIDLEMSSGATSVESHLAALGLEPTGVRIGWCGAAPDNPWIGSCDLSRGSVVSVTVDVWTPLIATPWGDVGGLWVSGEHSEPIDLYRSLG